MFKIWSSACAVLVVACFLCSSTTYAGLADGGLIGFLRRGDVNNDGAVDVSDISALNDYLYNGGTAPPCENQADVDDNGALNVSDSVYLSNYLFQGGPAPPAPGPNNTTCAIDTTTPNLTCYAGCNP